MRPSAHHTPCHAHPNPRGKCGDQHVFLPPPFSPSQLPTSVRQPARQLLASSPLTTAAPLHRLSYRISREAPTTDYLITSLACMHVTLQPTGGL